MRFGRFCDFFFRNLFVNNDCDVFSFSFFNRTNNKTLWNCQKSRQNGIGNFRPGRWYQTFFFCVNFRFQTQFFFVNFRQTKTFIWNLNFFDRRKNKFLNQKIRIFRILNKIGFFVVANVSGTWSRRSGRLGMMVSVCSEGSLLISMS